MSRKGHFMQIWHLYHLLTFSYLKNIKPEYVPTIAWKNATCIKKREKEF